MTTGMCVKLFEKWKASTEKKNMCSGPIVSYFAHASFVLKFHKATACSPLHIKYKWLVAN